MALYVRYLQSSGAARQRQRRIRHAGAPRRGGAAKFLVRLGGGRRTTTEMLMEPVDAMILWGLSMVYPSLMGIFYGLIWFNRDYQCFSMVLIGMFYGLIWF